MHVVVMPHHRKSAHNRLSVLFHLIMPLLLTTKYTRQTIQLNSITKQFNSTLLLNNLLHDYITSLQQYVKEMFIIVTDPLWV